MNREDIDRRIKALNDRIIRVKSERDEYPKRFVPTKPLPLTSFNYYKKRIEHLEKQIINVESEHVLDQLYNMHKEG